MTTSNICMLSILASILDIIIYMEYLKKLHIAVTEYTYIQYIGIIAAAVADTVSYLDFLLNNRYYLYIIPICILVVVYMKSQNICPDYNQCDISYKYISSDMCNSEILYGNIFAGTYRR